MDLTMYTSMLTANKILDKQAIIANNLANASTLGFKEQLIFQTSSLENDPQLLNNKKILSENNYPFSNFSSGPKNYTKRDLDLCIKGNGWFVIKDYNAKNKEGYTRNGHFKINTDGQLMLNHHLVIGKLGIISLKKNKKISISSSGKINYIDNKKEKKEQNIIEKLKLVNPNPKYLERGNNGIFYLNKKGLKKWKNHIPDNQDVKLTKGMLEDSNVNLNENLINMISNERHFSIEMKIISNADENIQRANQLLNINN